MSIRSPNSPGFEPHRFVSQEATDALSGRTDLSGVGLDAARTGSALESGGEALLGMDVWGASASRTLEAGVPASLAVGANVGEAIERAVDHILAPLS